MKLNYFVKPLADLGRRTARVLLSLVAIALMWQGAFFLNTPAIAAPMTLVATSPTRQVEGAADEVRDRSKDLIRDTKRNVERTANRNASKVDQADDEGTFVERKAQRDQARIERRAEEDASRTERAVDDSMNAVQGIAEKVRNAFSD